MEQDAQTEETVTGAEAQAEGREEEGKKVPKAVRAEEAQGGRRFAHA